MTTARLTVGVVTPHASAGPEVELPAMTSGRVTTVVSRTRPPPGAAQTAPRIAPAGHPDLRGSTTPDALDRASAMFAGTTLTAVVHASTTTGYLLGHHEEAELVERLTQRFDLPAVASCAAVAAALRAHQLEKIQVVHPPWFAKEFDQLGEAYFRNQGFDTVVTKAEALPNNPADVAPHSVIDWVENHVQDQTEAIFLAGNGLRAAQAIEELELRTGRLVIEANQTLLWGILEATGTDWDLSGHGRLLRARKFT